MTRWHSLEQKRVVCDCLQFSCCCCCCCCCCSVVLLLLLLFVASQGPCLQAPAAVYQQRRLLMSAMRCRGEREPPRHRRFWRPDATASSHAAPSQGHCLHTQRRRGGEAERRRGGETERHRDRETNMHTQMRAKMGLGVEKESVVTT